MKKYLKPFAGFTDGVPTPAVAREKFNRHEATHYILKAFKCISRLSNHPGIGKLHGLGVYELSSLPAEELLHVLRMFEAEASTLLTCVQRAKAQLEANSTTTEK